MNILNRIIVLILNLIVFIFTATEATTIGKKLQEQIQSSIQQRMGLSVAQVQVATEIEPLDGTHQTPVQ